MRNRFHNNVYNTFCKDYCDAEDIELDQYPYGKKIPYLDREWRYTDFHHPLTIGKADPIDGISLIGIVSPYNGNNANTRELTIEEHLTVLSYLDRAITTSYGYNSTKVWPALTELWNYIQTLDIQ